MPFVKIKTVDLSSRRKSHRATKTKRIIVNSCNSCQAVYEVKYLKKDLNRTITFCSVACTSVARKKGGPLYNNNNVVSARKAFRKKYDTKNPSDLDWVNEKKSETAKQTFSDEERKVQIVSSRRESCFEKYGVSNPMQDSEIRQRVKETCLARYGAENPFASKKIQQKIKNTNLEKYGVEHNSNVATVVEKRKATTMERFGVACRLSSPDVRKKAHNTMTARYGVKHGLQSKDILGKTTETMLKEYGVKYGFQSKEIVAKCHTEEAKLRRHKTMKRNGTYGKSKKEDIFYESLCEFYGSGNVERQVRINGWSIDFRVNDSYVQFDGVYWHGLDRELEVIKEFRKPRDKVIYKTYLRDKMQNKWFSENGITLIRVTDQEFEKDNRCPDYL